MLFEERTEFRPVTMTACTDADVGTASVTRTLMANLFSAQADGADEPRWLVVGETGAGVVPGTMKVRDARSGALRALPDCAADHDNGQRGGSAGRPTEVLTQRPV